MWKSGLFQDSQINAVGGSGSGLLLVNTRQDVYKETVPVLIKYAATIISIFGDYRSGGGGQASQSFLYITAQPIINRIT